MSGPMLASQARGDRAEGRWSPGRERGWREKEREGGKKGGRKGGIYTCIIPSWITLTSSSVRQFPPYTLA